MHVLYVQVYMFVCLSMHVCLYVDRQAGGRQVDR